MIKEGSKFYSVIHLKCPRCHQGDLYVNQHPYGFNRFFDMPSNCSHCDLKYQPEPGFFYGSMYVSYALSIIIAGLIWFVLTILDIDFWTVIWTVVFTLLLAIPPLFKYSRAIWLNFFMHYNRDYKEKAPVD